MSFIFNSSIILIISVFIVFIIYKISSEKCPPPVIKYRFVPRTLKEEMQSPVKLSEIYDNLFSDNTVFTSSGNGMENTK